jgi:hypothetical protein
VRAGVAGIALGGRSGPLSTTVLVLALVISVGLPLLDVVR